MDQGNERSGLMPELYIDGDACPVKEEALKVALRHNMRTHLVSNQWLRVTEIPTLNRVVVTDGFDAADNWIAENIKAGDIAITSDIPLAARCLEKDATVLGPTGKPFHKEGIGMALAMRDLMSHLRDTGEVSGHNASFTKQDRSRFLSALETAVQQAKRR